MTRRTILTALTGVLLAGGSVWASIAPAGAAGPNTTPTVDVPAATAPGTAPQDVKAPEATDASVEAPEPVEATDTDTLEEGDQTGPDAKDGPEEAEGTEGNEAGDESDTHEDVGEDAQHECPPACDTASGEQG